MHTRPLGNSDLHITPVGFGAWAHWRRRLAIRLGRRRRTRIPWPPSTGRSNWASTGSTPPPSTASGHSEEVVARALEEWDGPRPVPFYQVRHGLGRSAQDRLFPAGEASIRRECENSLRRLKTDCHRPLPNPLARRRRRTRPRKAGRTLAALQKEGKVRWIGASNFSREELDHAQAIAPVTSLQPPYSLIKRGVER